MTESSPDPLEDPRLAGFRTGLAGRYQIVRKLGEGGMAVVLLVRDLQHDRPVALKVLHPELTRALGGERFHQEVRLTARVQHPHIVSIYDSGETDGHLWFSMPYIEGESLRERLQREEQLPLAEAVRIIGEAARALSAAHQAGIVHRDIKPENLLLTPGGDVYVVDFGVARAVDSASLTRTGLAVGTPQYMSPEQASGKTEVNAASDVYTLGCVLYEMLAGEPPYNSRTPQGVSAKHLHSPIPDVRIIRETVSPALQQVLETALAKSPADRYPNAGALADAVDQAMATPPPANSWRVGKRATALAAVLAIVAVAYGALSVWRNKVALPPAPKGSPLIAVLYIENPSPDSSLNIIADGVTEELIRELTGASNAFRVVSKYGVGQFKNRHVPVDSMREKLGADYWVSGELRRNGGQVVVLVQLIDARTNVVLDSLSARSAGNNPFDLATDVALKVAASLKKLLNLEARLAPPVDSSTNPLATSLEFEAERNRRDAEHLARLPDAKNIASALLLVGRADSLLERAAREDTLWLRPWITRCWVAITGATLEGGPRHIASLRAGLKFAEEAIRRAPNDAAALEAKGTLEWKLIGASNADTVNSEALRRAEEDLRSAVGRDSLRASAWATLGELLWITGKLEQAELASSTALRVDPFLANAASVKSTLFYVELFLGKYEEAGRWCRYMRLEYPGDYLMRQCELTLLRHDMDKPPDPARAWELVAILDSLDPVDKAKAAGHVYTAIFRRILAATIDARAGNTVKAEAELARARRAAAGDTVVQMDMSLDEAYLLLALGRPEEARRLAEKFKRARPIQLPLLMRDRLYRQILTIPAPGSTAPR